MAQQVWTSVNPTPCAKSGALLFAVQSIIGPTTSRPRLVVKNPVLALLPHRSDFFVRDVSLATRPAKSGAAFSAVRKRFGL
jgi:hypothetical protein